MASRKPRVEHIVDSESLLPEGQKAGTDGATMSIFFYPFPGDGRVFIQAATTLPTRIGADASGVLEPNPRPAFFTKPLLPDISVDPDDIFAEPDDPPDFPPGDPKPLPLRVEVGPTGGPYRVVSLSLSGRAASFTVPDFPLPGDPETGPIAPAKSPKVPFPVNPLVRNDVPQWTCRVTNISDKPVKCVARVFFTVRRDVEVTRIPLKRFAQIFEGGLKWLIPTIDAYRGNIRVALSEEAQDTLEIDPKTIPIGGGNISDASVKFGAFRFDVIRPKQMLTEAFEDLKTHIKSLAAMGINVTIPASFVNKMVARAMLVTGGDLVTYAAELLSHPPNLDVKSVFDAVNCPKVSYYSSARSFDDNLALRVKLGIDSLDVKGTAAKVDGEILVENITLKLYVLINIEGRFDDFSLHPIAAQPRHQHYMRHRNEYISTTVTTWNSRFVAAIKDVDVEVNFDWGPIGEFAEVIVNGILDQLDWVFEDAFEDALNSAVRGFFASNQKKLARGVEKVLLQIANREHWLYDVRRDQNDLIIEHYDPVGEIPPRVSKPKPSPIIEPIDGPMPGDAEQRLAEIDHIVVVVMENRSFDHMLGYLSYLGAKIHPSTGRRTNIDGLTGNEQVALGGDVIGQPARPLNDVQTHFRPDPDHGYWSVKTQIGDGRMDGFIDAFRQRLSKAKEIEKSGRFDDERQIVNFLSGSQIPVYDYIAREFCVLDRWFSSFPGGTYPNRVCELAGQTPALTNRELRPNLGYLKLPTLFDLLTEAKVDWRVYEGDVSFLRFFDRHRIDFDRILPQKDFFNSTEPLKSVTFIDPNHTGAPSGNPSEDDHPPTDVKYGQAFLARVIKKLKASKQSWDRTLLIVTYDEHGGFYDHVAPPGTPPFHAANPTVSADITRVHPDVPCFGVRVPALLVSPRVARSTVGHKIYDHTTIIRTILQRFAPDRIGYMPERVRQARHLGEVLQLGARASIPEPPEIPIPQPKLVEVSTPGDGINFGKIVADPDDAREMLKRLAIPQSRR